MKSLKLKIIIILLTINSTKVFSQGYPVIDFTAIQTAITRLYTAYDELDGIFTTIEQGYKQLEQAYKAVENWKFEPNSWHGFDTSSLGAAWKSLDYREEIFGTLSQFESLQNRILEVQKIFDEKTINFLNGSGVTITELLGFKHNAVIEGIETGNFSWKENIKEAWKKVLQAGTDDVNEYKKILEVTQYLTEAELALYKRVKNSSPENYLYSEAKAETVMKPLEEAIIKASEEGKQIQSDANTILSTNTMKEILEQSDQTVPQLIQKLSMMIYNMNNVLNTINTEITDFKGIVAQAIRDNMDKNKQHIIKDSDNNFVVKVEQELTTHYDKKEHYDLPSNF